MEVCGYPPTRFPQSAKSEWREMRPREYRMAGKAAMARVASSSRSIDWGKFAEVRRSIPAIPTAIAAAKCRRRPLIFQTVIPVTNASEAVRGSAQIEWELCLLYELRDYFKENCLCMPLEVPFWPTAFRILTVLELKWNIVCMSFSVAKFW